jgi:hypothetical protein
VCVLKPTKTGEEGAVFHLLGEQKEAIFNDIHQFSSPRVKLMTCVATNTCVRGVFPLIFLPPGSSAHGGKLQWLGEEVGRVGEGNYSELRRAVKEGNICLPDTMTVVLPTGDRVFLPNILLSPRSRSRYPWCLVSWYST